MSQMDDIQTAQKTLEETFMKKMNELQAQLHNGSAAKDTVAKVADEFRTFRELIFSILSLLKRQILECTRNIDAIETRSRRKALVILGVPETDKEDCTSVTLGILHQKLALKSIRADTLKACHRLGKSDKDHHRPILVHFTNTGAKSSVWRAKKSLKGSPITIKEFLTKARQAVFAKARLHFGMRNCWTLDGAIIIKIADGSRLKVSSLDELEPLLIKHPKLTSSVIAKGPSPRNP